jgi:hypothetical protein
MDPDFCLRYRVSNHFRLNSGSSESSTVVRGKHDAPHGVNVVLEDHRGLSQLAIILADNSLPSL